MTNLFDNIPSQLPKELFEEILTPERLTSDNFRVERIVSDGHASPPDFWYDQDQHEWVVILQGEAGLQLANEATPRHLKTGDHLNIPAHQKHRVAWTSAKTKTIWLAIFY